MSGRREYLCYTDGACKPGEGAAGGWGFVVDPPPGAGEPIERYGSARGTMAKIMEARAAAEALAALPDGVAVIVFSDNQPLVLGLTAKLDAWREGGFAKVDPLVVESVKKIDACIREKRLAVTWRWVRGHAGNARNERADALAAQGAREAKLELTSTARARRR